MKIFDSIIVKPSITGKGLTVHNPTSLRLLGQGAQGAVFQIPDGKCVKIYWDLDNVIWESKALKAGKNSPHFPKLYEVGRNYIIMEEIKGPTLHKVICKEGTLPKGATENILCVLKTFKKINFKRIDTRLTHLIVANNKYLHVIDHIGAFQQERNVPTNLLKGLHELNLANQFMEEVHQIDPHLYREWSESL
jgi:predicted Ser/Thr protein kinase